MEQRPVYYTLNAMRGVAAIAVVLFHLVRGPGYYSMPSAYLAVDLFFVLSGFVIASAYDNRLSTGLTAGQFAWVRIARFWPLVLLSLAIAATRAVAAVAFSDGPQLSGSQIAAHLATSIFLVPLPSSDGGLFVLNWPLWTLSFELAVNIAYALLFRFLSVRAVVAIIAVAGFTIVYFALQAGTVNMGHSVATAAGGVSRTIFGFGFGVLLFRLRIRTIPVPAALLVVVLGVMLWLPVADWLRVPYDLAFTLVLSPLLVTLGASARLPARLVGLATWLGTTSFVIYALHGPLIGDTSLPARVLHLPTLVVVIGLVAILLAISPLIDRYYDQPFRRWLLRRGHSKVASTLLVREP